MLKIEYIKCEDLKPYERNTRKHGEEDVNEIAKSITKYGFNDPIGIYGNNIIVEGHGRLLAAKSLGMDEVPCIRLDHMTDKERREYAIMHNKTAELSVWDFDMLGDELAELDIDFDFGVESGEENLEYFANDEAIRDVDKSSFQVSLTFPETERAMIEAYLKEHTRRPLEKWCIEKMRGEM